MTDEMMTSSTLMAAPPAEGGDPPTILVAEDDPSTLSLLEHMLTRAGYRVWTARDGQEALDILADRRPALLLLDCEMPRVSGLEVCRRVKRDAELAHLPVIFTTVLSSPRDKARGYQVGGDDYITKPLERVELLARVHKQLELSRSQAQLQRQAVALAHQNNRLGQMHNARRQALRDLSRHRDLQLAVAFHPGSGAGDAFYDVLALGEQQHGLLVAEMHGDGPTGDYLVGIWRALTVAFTSETLSPDETLLMLHASLGKLIEAGCPSTACYLKYRRADRHLEWASAGHPPPLLLTRDGRCECLEADGDVLGGSQPVSFSVRRRTLDPGERLFIYTRGMLGRSAGGAGSHWNTGELAAALAAGAEAPLTEAVQHAAGRLTPTGHSTSSADLLLLGLQA